MALLRRVLIHRGAVVDCVRRIVDVVDGDVDCSRVSVSRIAGAVITDGVGEAVAAEVIRRRSVADASRREGDAAMCTLGDRYDRQTSVERRCQIVGIGVVGQHVDGVVGCVLIHGSAVVHRIRRIVDVVDGDVHCSRVSVSRIAGAVVTDGVGEAVTAEVIRRRCVANPASRKGDAAVRALGNRYDGQTGVEWRCQIVGISVVGEHVDGVVGRVLIDGGAVVDCVRRIVDVVDGDVHGSRVGVSRIAGAVITDGVGEAVSAEVVGRWCVADAACCKGDAAVCSLGDRDDRQTGVGWRRQIVGIGVVGQHVDGVVGCVLINCGTVVDRIRRIVDVVDGDVHCSRVSVSSIAGAVVTDGVSEAVTAEVVGVRRVADSACSKGDAAVRTLGNRDDGQTGVERRCQVVGIGVVGQHVDGVVGCVLIHRRTVVHCVRRIVDVVDGDIHCSRISVSRIAGAVITDGVGEAVTAEVIWCGSV